MLDKAMFSDLTCHEFGLSYGQIKSDAILHNAGWFNNQGEKLGYGDISYNDIENIQKDLFDDECFILLSENATSWSIPSELNRMEPGIDYVKNNASWFITKHYGVFKVVESYSGLITETKNKFYYDAGPLTAVLRYVSKFFESKATTSPAKDEKLFYGLKTAKLPDGEWAYGSRQELFQAAVSYTKDTLWLEDMSDIKKYVPNISDDEIDCLITAADNKGEKANKLIARIMGSKVQEWAEDIIHSKGVSRISQVDGCVYDSDDVIGLPTGLRAFRLD